ncbi:MAG: hypothetical protein JW904_07865 [Spirochaetales bacterium]|nr:hypothetical protein [Spirochaetales bacterium]
MSRLMKYSIALIILCMVVIVPAFSQVSDSDRVRTLESLFNQINDSVKSFKIMYGLGSITVGLGVGILTTILMYEDGKVEDDGFINASLAIGSVLVGGLVCSTILMVPLIEIILPYKSEILVPQFMDLPEGSDEEVRYKADRGEQMLAEMVDYEISMKRTRSLVLGGSGAACIVYLFAYRAQYADSDNSADGWIIGAGAGLIGLGLLQLFIKTNAEVMQERYYEWKASGGDFSVSKKNDNRFNVIITPVSAGVRIGL